MNKIASEGSSNNAQTSEEPESDFSDNFSQRKRKQQKQKLKQLKQRKQKASDSDQEPFYYGEVRFSSRNNKQVKSYTQDDEEVNAILESLSESDSYVKKKKKSKVEMGTVSQEEEWVIDSICDYKCKLVSRF